MNEAAPLHIRAVRSLRGALRRVTPRGVRDSAPVNAVLSRLGSMSDGSVVTIATALEDAGVAMWLAGGWGVDALAGRQTRRHGDLDLLVDRNHLDLATRVLGRLGYRHVRAGTVPAALLPERLVFENQRGRVVDMHPVDLQHWLATTVTQLLPDAAAPARDAFATGSLRSTPLPCLSHALQIAAHEGYERRAVDERDVALLRTTGAPR